MLQTLLATDCRIALWLAGGASLILGVIICYDGLTGSLAAQFRAVTFVASLFFALVGLGFFFLNPPVYQGDVVALPLVALSLSQLLALTPAQTTVLMAISVLLPPRN